jgi:hypothetical protein
MRSERVAEWILSQVLSPNRAASTVGDWMEDAAERGAVWFWSSVFRTVLLRVWSDFAESPGFMVGLALRGWLYSAWLIVGSAFGLFVAILIATPVVLWLGYLAQQLHWHLSWPFPSALVARIWIGWCEFKAGRWIARRAPGREITAGIVACLAPALLFFLMELLSMHFWASEINRFLGTHPDKTGSLPMTLPTELFLLSGILWARHKSIRNAAG